MPQAKYKENKNMNIKIYYDEKLRADFDSGIKVVMIDGISCDYSEMMGELYKDYESDIFSSFMIEIPPEGEMRFELDYLKGAVTREEIQAAQDSLNSHKIEWIKL